MLSIEINQFNWAPIWLFLPSLGAECPRISPHPLPLWGDYSQSATRLKIKEEMPVSVVLSESRRCHLTVTGTILVVEDPLVSKLVRAVLQRHGYDVSLVAPGEAHARLAAPDSNVGVLVTNEPEAFLEYSDRVPLLYLSSNPDVSLEQAFRSCRVVLKPFAPGQLVSAVGALVGA